MFSALERLRRLRAGLPISPPEEEIEIVPPATVTSGDQLVIKTWADLPADWRVDFEERAAIREYDGGQAREHAEAEALKEILVQMTREGWTYQAQED